MMRQLKTQARILARKVKKLGERALEEFKTWQLPEWVGQVRPTFEDFRKGLVARFAK